MTQIYIGNLNIIGSDNGLSLGRCQAIIWTDAGILLIGSLEIKFSEILIEIHTFPYKKMHLKMSFTIWRPFCLGLNELNMALSSRKRDLSYLCHLSVEKWKQIKSYFTYPKINSARQKMTETGQRAGVPCQLRPQRPWGQGTEPV